AINGPLIHGQRAQRAIKANSRLVPVEDSPFKPGAAALHRQPRECNQERFAVPAATLFRLNEQILQIDAGFSAKRGEIVEEERKANDLAGVLREQHLRISLGAE